MKVLFECALAQDIGSKLEIEKATENRLCLKITNIDYSKGSSVETETYNYLDREDLKDLQEILQNYLKNM